MSGPRRVRPALLVLGAGAVLMSGLPAAAAPTEPAGRVRPAGDQEALALLGDAAHAARNRSWTGTQYVATWRGGVASSSVSEVHHDPWSGTRVSGGPSSVASSLPAVGLDEQLLGQLADRYELSVLGVGTSSGRRAQVVEARRRDGQVAGRFWLDTDTGLPLRREVWDPHGRRLRSSAYVDLVVDADAAASRPAADPGALTVQPLQPLQPVQPGSAAGWAAPARLPGGYAMFDSGRPAGAGAVLHQAYSDGLSTVSLFSQPGSLGQVPAGYRRQEVAGTPVWVQAGTPERLVWSGGGQVFTMISDAAHDDLLAAVGSLPRDGRTDGGLLRRLGRGLARVGSWLDPTG